MPVYRGLRMLRQNLLLKECLNMILMPDAITMVTVMLRGMSADIMVKIMDAVTIMAMKAAAIITERRSL